MYTAITSPARIQVHTPESAACNGRWCRAKHGPVAREPRRAVGPGGRAVQLTTSYYPPDIASGTPVEQADTGPGGVYDRIEQDLGHGPLTWTTQTSARLPTPEEADVLNMSTRLPVLVNTRVAANSTHRVVAVDIAVLDAQLFAVRWDVTRDDTATWPVTLATARNKPH